MHQEIVYRMVHDGNLKVKVPNFQLPMAEREEDAS